MSTKERCDCYGSCFGCSGIHAPEPTCSPSPLRWECWPADDGYDECARETSRQPSPATAAELYASGPEVLQPGESIDIRVKAIGSDDATARTFRVRARLEYDTVELVTQTKVVGT